jgi:DNA-binding NtrC family response regulator
MASNIYTKRMKNMANILAVDDEKAILNMIENVLTTASTGPISFYLFL